MLSECAWWDAGLTLVEMLGNGFWGPFCPFPFLQVGKRKEKGSGATVPLRDPTPGESDLLLGYLTQKPGNVTGARRGERGQPE